MEGRERDGDLGSDSFSGLQSDLGMVLLRDLFYNREPEPGTAGRLGMALVDAIESVEDPGLMGAGDTDARVPYALGIVMDSYDHGTVVPVVSDRVVDQVEDQLA